MEKTSMFRKIRQGGMGVYISGPRLAKTVSMLDQAGTVSGVVPERVMARILQRGDPGGDFRRALSHFPFPRPAEKVLAVYYEKNGIPPGRSYKGVPVFSINPPDLLIALTVCASFAFVWLAKEGHESPVAINYLEKINMPHIYAITGAMLAGVDEITMGAGVAMQIPKVIRDIAFNKTASYRVPVIGNNIKSYTTSFNPESFFGEKFPLVERPGFIPIIASNRLASIFRQRLPAGSVAGFAIEEWKAGGHNAPPQKIILDEKGEPLPIYGDEDVVDYRRIAELGLPFWIGGAKASPEMLKEALAVGATGIQVGSIFALCDESDMDPEIKKRIRRLGFEDKLVIRTDMRVSPTGFPFKVAELDGTISESSVYQARRRVCNQGALLSLYEKADGTIGYRCPGEPVDKFVAKGGDETETIGRSCICNALSATAGIGNSEEAPIVTLGDDLGFLKKVMATAESSYSAQDAIRFLLGDIT
jgi:NAD(P)H-dependent flavin oxidoreductase YrpB (nitropropane dioxygenase family)